MNRTIEMILMTLVIILIAAFLGTTMISCTSNDDDQPEVYEASMLYAIVKPEGAQLIDIIPQDYVLTLDNIIAVNRIRSESTLCLFLYLRNMSSNSIQKTVSSLRPS